MSRQRSVWIVSAALLCLTLPRPAAAQDTGADGSAQREAALQALRPGQLVRISAHGVRDTGRVAAASSSQLTFRHPDPVARPVASIDSLWTWKSNAGGGARIGAIVVGTLGALVGYSFSGAALDYEPSGTARLKMVVPLGIAGGLVGAMFGGMIGGLSSHWQLKHPGRT